MSVEVTQGDPSTPGAVALLRQSHALMQSLFASEDNHFLSIEALQHPDIAFFIAKVGEDIAGTAALRMTPDYGEIKSMFVADTARGQGVGEALLRAVENHARHLKLPRLNLETGDLLHAAHRLYRRQGYEACDAFGSYEANPSSLFMTKPLR